MKYMGLIVLHKNDFVVTVLVLNTRKINCVFFVFVGVQMVNMP